MPMPFIKYTPDIEAADPRFDETLQTVAWRRLPFSNWWAGRS
jgi:hypothetical protein